MISQRLTCLLILALGYCTAERRLEVCDEPSETCGPIPPSLPESFVMKGSRVDVSTKSFSWFEEYFDPVNLRGKYVEISEGRETHMIFDYYTQQIISYFDIHPGANPDKNLLEGLTCMVEEMSDSPSTIILGRKFGYYDKLRPRMYNSYETLRYGGPYKYTYDAKDSVDFERGLPCTTFKGCVYDPNEDATYRTTFRWASNKTVPPFATQNMPIRILETGGYYTEVGNADPVWNVVDTDRNIVWYEENPYMDTEIFQPPKRMECKNQRPTDDVTKPSMPVAFSTRMETFITTENWKGEQIALTQDKYQEIWYDSSRKLIRHDYLPSLEEDIVLLQTFDKISMVTAVHDFNSGLSFYTDKVQGLCLFTPIAYELGDKLVLSRRSSEGNVVMASPQEILGIDEELRFKGQYKVRGMDCNGFSGRVNKTAGGTNDPVSVLREVYIASEGWHEDIEGQENFEFPVQDIEVSSIKLNGQEGESISSTNYYKFLPTPPHLAVYDISACTLTMNKKYFGVQLKVTQNPQGLRDMELLDKYHDIFLDSAHILLTEGADLGTPIRIQDLKIGVSLKGETVLNFTMLDVFGKTGSVSSPRRGQPLEEASATLATRINTGTALIEILTNSFTKETAEIILVPKTLTEIKKKIFFESYPLNGETQFVPSQPTPLKSNAKDDTKTEGFSKGSLAGLAIGMLILGLGVGAAIMLLYFKKFMKPKDDLETADFTLQAST